MADDNTVEIPLLLENVLRYSLNNARERMEKGEVIVPFTALAVGETLFFEEHPADEPADSFASARRTVSGATGARAYGFTYDGYVDTDTGRTDALIAEGGMPGEPYGHAIGLIYRTDKEGNLKFREQPIYVGPSSNYLLYNLYRIEDDEAEEPEQGDGAEESAEGEAPAEEAAE